MHMMGTHVRTRQSHLKGVWEGGGGRGWRVYEGVRCGKVWEVWEGVEGSEVWEVWEVWEVCEGAGGYGRGGRVQTYL